MIKFVGPLKYDRKLLNLPDKQDLRHLLHQGDNPQNHPASQ